MKKAIYNSFNWLLLPLIIYILLRVALIILLYKLSGGAEFTSDTWVFDLGLHPLSVLTFSTDASLYSQPPLLPIILAPLALSLSSLTTQFLAARISYTVIEFLMFLTVAIYVGTGAEFVSKSKRAIMTILAVSPLGFMTGAIMCEEEAIVALFTAIVILFVRNKWFRQAAMMVILGILAGKILFGIVFIGLLFVAPNKRDIFYFGILPCIVVLGAYSLLGYKITGTIPFLSFSPGGVPFCSSIFNLIQYFISMTGPLMKWLSLALLATIFVIIRPYLRILTSDDFPMVLLMIFCTLFFVFYHMNVEYYIFALPLLSIVPYMTRFRMSRTLFHGLHFALGITAWGYAIIYGIRVYSMGGSGSSYSKEWALEIYNRFLGFLPLQGLEISLLVVTLLIILIIGVFSFWHLRKSTSL